MQGIRNRFRKCYIDNSCHSTILVKAAIKVPLFSRLNICSMKKLFLYPVSARSCGHTSNEAGTDYQPKGRLTVAYFHWVPAHFFSTGVAKHAALYTPPRLSFQE